MRKVDNYHYLDLKEERKVAAVFGLDWLPKVLKILQPESKL